MTEQGTGLRQGSALRGRIVPVVDADIRSAYPAGFCLLGCSDILRARELNEVDAVADLQSLGTAAVNGEFAALFDPATYLSLFCLAEVRYAGEPGPVELRYAGKPAPVDLPGGRSQRPSFHIARLFSSQPLPVTGPDVVLGALLSHRVPEILSATRLEPVGIEHTRPFPLYDGLIIQPGGNPIAAGVRLRSTAKDSGDKRLPVQLRVFLNAMAWGQAARLDQRRVNGQLIETPAAMTWPPIASTVPAVARMWLAMVERMVTDAGGAIVTRDTDGLAILASPDGGRVTLSDGSVVQALSWE